jgi:hypothetical protein
VVFALGLGWDVLYTYLQKQRWDHDWPPILQLAASILEGLFVCLILYGLDLLPALPSLGVFWLHYMSVWVTTFLASQSLMRLLFPRWRYRGGRWM